MVGRAASLGCGIVGLLGFGAWPRWTQDDATERFVVQHYRYDPDRGQRRHAVVAAFDNDPELMACMQQESRRSGGAT